MARNLRQRTNELGLRNNGALLRALKPAAIREERFNLTSQARRAANSIVLNIAEGSGRGTKKDLSHFLDMALGSTFETVACFFVARGQFYVSQHDLDEMKRSGESLSKRINAFKRTLR